MLQKCSVLQAKKIEIEIQTVKYGKGWIWINPYGYERQKLYIFTNYDNRS